MKTKSLVAPKALRRRIKTDAPMKAKVEKLMNGQCRIGLCLLPGAHRVFSLLKRWLLGTHQGAIGYDHLDDYLNEFTFRFNQRKSATRGRSMNRSRRVPLD